MNNRLILSELRLLVDHYTTSDSPSPEFMRLHVASLSEAIDSWASSLKGPIEPQKAKTVDLENKRCG